MTSGENVVFRVVAFCRRPEAGQQIAAARLPLHYIRCDGAYEAAAEMLAEPALALIVDLSLLAPRHLRLLELARLHHVEILALGCLPAGAMAETFSGVRLMSEAALPQALAQLIQHLASHPPHAPAAHAHVEAEGEKDELAPQNAALREAVPAVRLTPAKNVPAEPPAAKPGDYIAEPPPPTASQPPRLGELLTPEELAALLQNKL